MGGGLAFLNKKTWHPGRLSNVEELWKREQRHETEKRKLAELQKQINDERQKEELEQVAEAAGHKIKSDRLDWMYQGGVSAKQDADKRAEEQMLNGAPVTLKDDNEVSKAEKLALLPAFYAEDTPASANETWARLHSDPLFAIKQQEITTRKQIVANPVQMDAIKREVEAIKLSKAQRKAAKQAKKEKRKEEKAQKKQLKAALEAMASGAAPPPSPQQQQQQQHPARPRSPSPDRERPHKHRRVESPTRKGEAGRGGEAARHDQDGRRRHSEREGRDDHREHRHRRDGDAEDRHGYDKQDRRRERSPHDVRVHVDGASSQQAAHLRFGLNSRSEADEADRAAAAEATRQRLEEAARKREQEERERVAQRTQRKPYRTGQMDDEERARRLAEMAGDAAVHEEARWARLKRAREEDEEDGVAATNAAEAKTFLKELGQEVYGATGGAGGTNLAEMVGRRKHYQQRGGSDGHAFRKYG